MKKYEYPESFGDCGEFLSEEDFNTMANWPAMKTWYEEAVVDGYTGTYQEYIIEQKKRCTLI